MTWNDYGVPDMKLNMFPVLLFNPKNPMGSGYGWPHFRDEKIGPQRGQSCDQKEIKLGSELLWQKNVLSIITLSWFTKINIGSRMPGESKSSVISFLFFFSSFFFFFLLFLARTTTFCSKMRMDMDHHRWRSTFLSWIYSKAPRFHKRKWWGIFLRCWKYSVSHQWKKKNCSENSSKVKGSLSSPKGLIWPQKEILTCIIQAPMILLSFLLTANLCHIFLYYLLNA